MSPTRTRAWLALTLFALATPAFAQSKAEEEAGDVSEVDKDAAGPLRERIRPVSGHLFLMKERFELSPELGISVRDAFFTKYLFGAALTYHFSEAWAVSLHGGYTMSVISNAAQICTQATATSAGGCRSPTWDELTSNKGQPANKAYGLTAGLATLDLQFSPIYGKLSLSAEGLVHFNLYLLAGPAAVFYGPTNSPTVGGNVGLGLRFVLNKWLALRAEFRDTIYVEQSFFSDENGNALTSVRNQLMFDLGFSMFFPTLFEEGR
jgi:outer membrane beta-barrel protein